MAYLQIQDELSYYLSYPRIWIQKGRLVRQARLLLNTDRYSLECEENKLKDKKYYN